MGFRNFGLAKAWLESLIPLDAGASFGLERIRALLAVMGNPQESYATVHVGGTAGKGSTATIIARILQDSGYRTGLHVSPHLEDIRERGQVNGKLMTKREFVDLVNRIRPCVEQTARQHGYGMPTYFEVLVALALQHFKDKMVDIAVIEVGLGGRLDGTNIITPKVAVLTNVGLDHTEFLGMTVGKIARDKTGIFKEGIDIVSGVTQQEVVRIVKDKARDMNCRLDLLGRDIRYDVKHRGLDGTVFDLRLNGLSMANITTPLLGVHQVTNAAVAIDAVLKLNGYGFSVGEKGIRSALRGMSIPCRFEVIRENPTVVLDGAHNPMKTGTLVKALKQYYPGRRISIVFAVKKDKNVAQMLRLLSGISKRVYLTRFQTMTDFGQRMSMEPESIPRIPGMKYEVLEDAGDAYRKAVEESGRDSVICVTGSLYLVGELRGLLNRRG